MAYTAIDDPSAHFQVKTYSGNSTQTAITFDGSSNLQPDWIWAKQRGGAHYHDLRDTSRGLTKRLVSAINDAEGTKSASYVSFDSNGFTLGDDQSGGSDANTVNSNGNTYVSWCWKANGGTTSSNSDGDITATVQANTTAGFSIMTWTSNNADNQTIGHGLGAAPEVFWVKTRDATGSWYCYFKEAGATHYLRLNSTDARVDNVIWGDTHPTSSVITVDTNSLSGGTPTVVSYAFKQIQGYSKFGTYEANNSTDGPFVYTGFQPAWVMLKSIDSTGNWFIMDSTRSDINVSNEIIFADLNAAEDTSNAIDFLSNGFKLRNSGSGGLNYQNTYLYMAFAEHPFVSSKGVPTTAK